jgi:hypothetical protein
MSYVTVADLRVYAGFDSEEDDTILDVMVAAASETIDRYCGRTFKAATANHTFRRDAFDGSMLWLHPFELADVADAITGSPTVYYLPDQLPYDRLVLDDGDTVGWTYPTIVTGPWGYSLSPDGTIVECTLRLAKWLYGMREGTPNDNPIVTPQGIVLVPNKLPADVVSLLAPYRKWRIA